MSIPESLSNLNQTLNRFQRNPFEWDRLCDQEQQLHTALRDAVQCGCRECFLVMEACYRLLCRGETIRQLERGYGHSGHSADLTRWRGNALALIATAQAAIIAGKDPQARSRFWKLWRRASRDLGTESETWVFQPQWPAPQSPLQVIEEACRLARERNAPWPIETLRNWTLYWLPNQFPPADRMLEVPIGVFRSDGSFVARLLLEVLSADTPPALVEHPLGALQRLGCEVIQTLQSRYAEGTQRAVRWRLVPDRGHSSTLIDGDSLDGAAVVAFHCIANDKPYDRNSLIAAKVDPDRKLLPVGEETEKLDAAWQAGIRRACVAASRNRTSDFASLRSRGMDIIESSSLTCTIEFATGVLAGLHAFIRAEIGNLLDDANARLDRNFSDFSALTHLLVDVQVARGLRPRLTKGELEALERQRASGDYSGIELLEREKFDLRAAESQEKLPAARPTEAWEEVRDNLKRAAVLGDPGFGKTTLLWREVGRRCQDGLAAGDIESTEFAVFVRCAEVAESLTKHDDFLRALMSRLRERQGMGSELELVLQEKLTMGDCLIALDALDEVSDPRRLKEKLEDFARTAHRARILVSSRLAGFSELPFVAVDDHVEILRLEEPEMEQLVRGWLEDAAAADALWALTGEHPYIGELLHCPLLLRLACQMTETVWQRAKAIPRWEQRGDLYRGFLEKAADSWFQRYVEAGGQNRTLRGLFLQFASPLCQYR